MNNSNKETSTGERSLNKEVKIAAKHLERLTKKQDAIKLGRHIKKMKAAYVGKHFVYDNGYNSLDRWKKYCHCTGVDDAGYLIYDSFESTTDGEHKFEIDKTVMGEWLFETQIHENVYKKALLTFSDKLKSLKP